MSCRRCAGFMEGIDGVPEDRISEARLKCLPVNNISPLNHFADIEFQAGVFEQPYRPLRIKLD